MKATAKIRIDLLLVERGLVPSRERARAMILAGRVMASEQKVDKPGATVAADAPIRLLGDDRPYVSRGGLKLAAALDRWQIDVKGRWCLDVGASTGGFTDCLLQHGAAHVTAVDTGFGQIAMALRNDARVPSIQGSGRLRWHCVMMHACS
jgi:23S rRNA (cytidine1920-2'-O)/16S rRNA (cytidine1409-2'-O)-methyltransferase